VAYIADLYRRRIEKAFTDRDRLSLCRIAKAFYSRVFKRPFEDWECRSVFSNEAFFALEVGDDRFVCRCRRTGKWIIGADPRQCFSDTTQHQVVEALSIPFAFLEGVFSGVTIAERHAGQSLDDIDRKRAHAIESLNRAMDVLSNLNSQIANRKKIADARSITALDGFTCLREHEEPASPPQRAGLVHDAKSILKGVCGIYFVYRDSELIYVGKAYDVGRRLSSHHVATDSDYVSVVSMKPSDIHLAELFYIYRLRPKLNHEVRMSNEENKARQQFCSDSC
jgi:hypothetical protein